MKLHLFVSCEHPDSDASIGQALDGLRHACLQLVLNGRAAQQQQVPLYQVPDCCKLLLTPCQGCLGLEVLLLPPVVNACSLITAVDNAADSDTDEATDTDTDTDTSTNIDTHNAHHINHHHDVRMSTTSCCGRLYQTTTGSVLVYKTGFTASRHLMKFSVLLQYTGTQHAQTLWTELQV